MVANLFEDHRGNIWLATYGGGISKIDKNLSNITNYTQADGLVSNATLAIIESAPDVFWISSNNGLSRFDSKTEKFVNFKVGDGLQADEFQSNAVLRTQDGELFFGGTNGFNRFYPQDVVKSNQPLTVKLTQIRVANIPVTVRPDTKSATPSVFSLPKAPYMLEKLELTHHENLISFEFSALSYAQPETLEFQYKLSNFDRQWITTDHSLRRATYTNIPAGEYQLQVRAKMPHNEWQNNAMALTLVVHPAPWRSWWAYSIYVMLVFTVVGAFVLQRYNRFTALKASQKSLTLAQTELSHMNDKLEFRVIERTAQLTQTLETLKSTQIQLVESEKMSSLVQLIVGVAHELNTPLGIALTATTSVQDSMEVFGEKVSQGNLRMADLTGFLANSHQGLDLLYSNLNRTIGLVRTFKQLSPKSTGEPTTNFSLHTVLVRFSQENSRNSDGVDVEIKVTCPQDLKIDTYVNDLIKVLQQLLDNACIHAFNNIEKPAIAINVSNDENTITLQFADNGVGLSADQLKKVLQPFYTSQRGSNCTGLGLPIVYNTVYYRLAGNITFDSEPGKGFAITINLPVTVTVSDNNSGTN